MKDLHEDGIVWLEDIEKLDYVRVAMGHSSTRKGRPRFHGRLVGYATVSRNNTDIPGHFDRRCFTLQRNDPYDGGCPCEAVDPRTLAPNQSGEKTDRVCGEHVGPWPVVRKPVPASNASRAPMRPAKAVDVLCRWANLAQIRYVERVSSEGLDDAVNAANDVHQVTRDVCLALGRTKEFVTFAKELKVALRFCSNRRGSDLAREIQAVIDRRSGLNGESILAAANKVYSYEQRISQARKRRTSPRSVRL